MIHHDFLKNHADHTVFLKIIPAGQGALTERVVLWCIYCDLCIGTISNASSSDP